MKELEVYTFPATGEGVRVVARDDATWFVGKDACAILDIADARSSLNLLDEDERDTIPVTDGLGRKQPTIIISEPGLYSLILRSRRPEAKAFKRWITHDVLPSIRRTGSYGQAPALPSHPDALRAWAAEIEARQAAEARAAALAPAAESWTALAEATGDYAMADAAEVLSRDDGITTGERRLFALLAEWGWVYRGRGDGYWRAAQAAVEPGWLVERARSYRHPVTGEATLSPPQVRVTVDGLASIRRRLAPVQSTLTTGEAA